MNDKTLRQQMWDRLTANPSTLGLDVRVDEEPEDYFVRLAQSSGKGKEIVSALRELLAVHVVRQPETDLRVEIQFLTHAFRLSDALGDRECKEPLKLFLLEENEDRWGHHLLSLQELAARALLSLPKEKSEIRFWSEVAFMRKSTCPYALNAVLELDLAVGIDCVYQVYLNTPDRLRNELADWNAILWMAKEKHGEKEFKKVSEAFLMRNLEDPPIDKFFKLLAEIAGIPNKQDTTWPRSTIDIFLKGHHRVYHDCVVSSNELSSEVIKTRNSPTKDIGYSTARLKAEEYFAHFYKKHSANLAYAEAL